MNNINIYSLTDLIPNILNELSIKELLNISSATKILNNEVKYIKKNKLITKSNTLLNRRIFDSWCEYIVLKVRGRRRVCSWREKFKDPERAILLF